MGLRANLLAAVLADLPDPSSRLSEPDPQWDALLGGRTGPNAWSQYARGFGTTCIVSTNGWLRAAGAPDEMVISEPTPNGGGTKMIQRQIAYAKAMGWLHEPVRGELPDLRPGDIYNINHDARDKDGNPVDGTHEGVIVSVTPGEDGQSLIVETADGGQGTRQDQAASRSTRTFKLSDGPHPVVVQSPSGPAWLDRWIAVGGDEPDAVVEPDNGTATAVALAGAGLVILALVGWSVAGGHTDPIGHAMAATLINR